MVEFVPRAFPSTRLRRLRQQGFMRDLLQNHQIHVNDLIYPIFIVDGERQRQAIPSMPGVWRLSLDYLVEEVQYLEILGIQGVVLFPNTDPRIKTEDARAAVDDSGLVQNAVRAIKATCSRIGVFTDVALDPYTTHGQDGVLNKDSDVDNDASLAILSEQAVSHAKAGADVIAPSNMMDGYVRAIRQALDVAGFSKLPILAYAAKYASAYYGPFRDAVGSGEVLKGDKKTYQMSPANSDEALHEVALDLSEGCRHRDD